MPKLYVVATPIGNLSDTSPRVLEVLRGVSLIAAEDTRVTGKLLSHFSISKPLTSLHRHNEAQKAQAIIDRMLREDIDVALTTDAGTPAISDPGHILVERAWAADIAPIAIAGPTAIAAALSVSGFDAREFAFFGFLPRERGDLVRKLLSIAGQTRVAVLYESPHRITALAEAIDETLPGSMLCVCCDLTKRYEKTLRGTSAQVLQQLYANPNTEKGEYCVILDLQGVRLPPSEGAQASTEALLLSCLMDGQSLADAIEALAARGIRKNEAKRAALRAKAFLADNPYS